MKKIILTSLLLFIRVILSSKEREALISLYKATGGKHWVKKTNWRSNSPISTWYGITVENGHVTKIELSDNRLIGGVPLNIGNLKHLQVLNFNNDLEGEMSEYNDLTFLDVSKNIALFL